MVAHELRALAQLGQPAPPPWVKIGGQTGAALAHQDVSPMLNVMLPSDLESCDLAALSTFPLPNWTVRPGDELQLHVYEPRYREMTREALGSRKIMAVARLQRGFESDYEERPPVFEVCGVGFVEQHQKR